MSMGNDTKLVAKNTLRRVGGMSNALSIAAVIGFSSVAPPPSQEDIQNLSAGFGEKQDDLISILGELTAVQRRIADLQVEFQGRKKQFSELLMKAASDYGALTTCVADFQWIQNFKEPPTVWGAPGMDVMKVPLIESPERADNVSVWEWSGSAVDEGDVAAKWFTDYLGKPSRLVRFNNGTEVRSVDPDYAVGYKVMFSDGYPFLLLSQGSLDALNTLLKEPVPVNRFRTNILVDGCEPFSEDLWTEIRINKLTFQGVKLCARCKVPTIDQETAIAGHEPTETLKSFRSDKELRPNRKQQKGRVYFGQNMVCKDSLIQGKEKMVKVGDPVFVLKMVSSPDDAAA